MGTNEGQIRVTNVITKSLARILKLQSFAVKKECRSNIVKRGLDRSVILERNISVNCIITDLLSDQFCDKDEVLRLQHHIYRNLMELEVKSIAKERTFLNAMIAKERRILKSITTDQVFKLCNDFMQKRRTDEMISLGSENEVLWKGALLEKEAQAKSIDEWLNLINAISLDKNCGDMYVSKEFRKFANVSFSDTMVYSFIQQPTTCNEATDILMENREERPEPCTVRENRNDVRHLPQSPTRNPTSERFVVTDNDIMNIDLREIQPLNSNEENPPLSHVNVIENVTRENPNHESDNQSLVNAINFERVEPRPPSRNMLNENRIKELDRGKQPIDADKENIPPLLNFSACPTIPRENPNRKSDDRNSVNAISRRALNENYDSRKVNIRPSRNKESFNRFKERSRFYETRNRQYDGHDRLFSFGNHQTPPLRYNQDYFHENDGRKYNDNFSYGRRFR